MSKNTHPDKLQHHLNHLVEMKKDLDKRIESLYSKHVKDEIVTELKMEKVRLNDEIAAIKKQLDHIVQ